jgi:hypothetical protein
LEEITVMSLSKLPSASILSWPAKFLMALSLWCAFAPCTALAHASSNSYLTLSKSAEQLSLRADVNFRDLDLIFDLDRNRDGQVTWGEVQLRSSDINAWLVGGIHLSAKGSMCKLDEADLQVTQHADGLYLSALWQPLCLNELSSSDLLNLKLRYELIFEQDNLHRALLKIDLPEVQTSALLSPDRPETQISSAESRPLKVFGNYVLEGVWHIWIGIDHIAFLLSLLLLAPLKPSRQKVVHWQAADGPWPVIKDVLAVVTAFTIAHSITLGLTITGWLTPPPDFVEPAIALSVVFAAMNNLFGASSLKRWRLAFVFGLIHGFGFASVLLDLGLPSSALMAALGGFNIGVEIGQLAIVGVFLPLAWLLRQTVFYRWFVVVGGSTLIVVAGIFWTVQRLGWL